MAYLRYLIATTLAVLALAASLNFLIDPGSVYWSNHGRSAAYAEALIKSEHGLWWPDNSLEDRAIKKALSKYSNSAECVVIGSSHVMQIGSARTTKRYATNALRS